MPSGGLKGLRTILTSPRKVKTPVEDPKLEDDFESLLRDQDISEQLRDKLRGVDASVKQAFLSSSSSPSCPARPSSPRKHQRTQSKNFLSPTKKPKVIVDYELNFEEPVQFIRYLSTRTPDKTRIDIVKKLRLLLRSQRITWINEFVSLAGSRALSLQVSGIIKIEWREDHEDQLLYELLGCWQSMCTTTLGIEKLNTEFLQMITGLLFSEKQPSDFRCRGQIMNLLELYLTANDKVRHARASQVLSFLADPVKPLSERPLEMLEKAHSPRPYKRWMTELEKPVRDCFWIFLHSDNMIDVLPMAACDQMVTRKPIVPEGYVGGVEWTAVEYICSHLSLVNALLASMPREERQTLRQHLKTSHFEKICGGQLRRASSKFYASIPRDKKPTMWELKWLTWKQIYLHEQLVIWASRANADEWPVTTVTCGRTRDDSSVRNKSNLDGKSRHRKTQSTVLPELQF